MEEPNANIFLKPILTEEEKIFVEYSLVDYEKCNLCGKCGELCKFNGFCCKKLKKLKLGKLIPNFYRIYATTPIIFLTKLN